MPSKITIHRTLRWTTLLLGILNVGIVGYALLLLSPDAVQARILPHHRRPALTWEFVDQEKIKGGATIPANTHVVFHLPLEGFNRISREVLLGKSGEESEVNFKLEINLA